MYEGEGLPARGCQCEFRSCMFLFLRVFLVFLGLCVSVVECVVRFYHVGVHLRVLGGFYVCTRVFIVSRNLIF